MKTKLLAIANGWDRFWFAPKDLYNIALVRCLLGAVMFVMYSIRFTNFETFYTEKGILPLALKDLFMPAYYSPLFSVYFVNEIMAWWAHLLFIVLLLLLCLGLIGRLGTFVLFLLHIGFMQRNYAIVYGADLFSAFWLLYLSLVKHNISFTLLSYLPFKRTAAAPDLLSTVGWRLMQIQLCVSYAYTGIEKLKGDQWWEGTAVWYVLGMRELLAGDFTVLQNFPLIIGALTIATVIFEVYFPLAVFNRHLRPYWLVIGLLFHIGTAVFLNLPFFCLIMIIPYLLFIPKEKLIFVLRKVRLA